MHESKYPGLTSDRAAELLLQHGANELKEAPDPSFIRRVLQQLGDPMVLVLLAAALLSGFMSEWVDAIIILAVVLINTGIGLAQEEKAHKAIEALKQMTAQTARCLRDGQIREIPARELVPGDVVLLDAGDHVPADLRLFTSASLRIEEAALTGESVPAEKDAEADVLENSPLGDRVNQAFMGTSVTYGRGRGVVAATGAATEMGRIAGILSEEEDSQTPLQRKLAEIGKTITIIVLAVCVFIFVLDMVRVSGFTLAHALNSFLAAISLAVAAIPEGLPAVVTIVLALGVTRMAKRKAIVRRLPAVETLGCAQIICSDKTGTLTQNRMTVRMVYAQENTYAAEEYESSGAHDMLCAALYLCNDSVLAADGDVGDPTETALKRFVLQEGFAAQYDVMERRDELPFDSERKLMSTVNLLPQGQYVLVKGAPDELLRRCTNIELSTGAVPITEKHIEGVLAANSAMAAHALRVLAAAYKPYSGQGEFEEGLTFAGLVGMIDPPRPEVYEAVAKCRDAGILPVMITGDHKDTALAVAREIGLLPEGAMAVSGAELDAISDAELEEKLERIRVYARVSPEHKVRIVRAWKKLGKVVAMTGDGVNDAPAIKSADIGIGMGITGTDVSKGVADMLLSDDNFATIVAAVEEGRKIFINIRKTVHFLLCSNFSEVLALLIATLILPAGTRLLGPVHILFINLVTDSLPAIALGLDPAAPNLMLKSPRDQKQGFFSGGLMGTLIYQGLIMAALTLASYFIGKGESALIGTTMAFVTLSTVQLFHAFSVKMEERSVFSGGVFNNPTLLLSSLFPLALLAFIIGIPAIGEIFSVAPLSTMQWVTAVGLSLAVIPAVEVVKLALRLFSPKTEH